MTEQQRRTRLAPSERRALIIDAATRQIAEGGYNTFTLSKLAEDCGMTRAGIEHHFSSREELLIAVLLHRDDLDAFAITTPVEGRDPRTFDEDSAWKVLDNLVIRNAGQPELLRLYTILGAEALDPQHPAHDYFAERTRTARDLLADLSGSWHPQPRTFALAVLAVLDGLQLQWLRFPDEDLVALWKGAGGALARKTA